MKASPVMNNAAWTIGCRVIQSLLQLVVGMLCARYLGPGNYGLLNYAASILAFALPFMRLGLNETLVRELVESPEKDGEVMGTALTLNVLSSLACMGAAACFVSNLNRGDRETMMVCILCSISLFFGALEMIRYWFQYKLLAKYSAVASLIAYTAVSAYRLWLLAAGKSVRWFALANSMDYGIIALCLTAVFLAKGHRFRFSGARAKGMLRRSCPYIAASLMVVLFQSTDRIMLTAMVGTHETGLYSAAVTCVTMGQFVYVAIVDSFRPVILSGGGHDRQISRLYGIILYLALAQGVVFTLFADWIVLLLYGGAYSGAVPVLKILNWYFVFSCMGLVRNVWILAEEKQKYLWRINLSGAVLNIGLNLWLIPLAGARGAAFASALTQFFANFGMGWLIAPIRENNRLLLRGLHPAFLREELMLRRKITGEDPNAGENHGTKGRG